MKKVHSMETVRRLSATVGFLALVLGGSAHAGQMVTGGVKIKANQVVACTATNVTETAQDLKVELFDGTNASTGSVSGPVSCPKRLFGGTCLEVMVGDINDRFVSCKITTSSLANTRGMIANLTSGVSSEAK
jgi:hypothetical protein